MSRLFYEDEFDAVRSAIADSGRAIKDVAAHLWPGMKPESAAARLRACLNADKDQRLDFGEIVALCRFCGRFDPLHYMADELAHERPKQITREDELTQLLRRYLDLTGEKDKLGARIEKIRSAA